MTKYSKIKKSSFAILALALILVSVFAFGGTYAYFNAKVSSDSTTVTAGTLTLNGKYDGTPTISFSDTTKIVPNQTIDLSSKIGAVTIEGNTVAALRIKISGIQITKVGQQATTTDPNVVLSLLAADGTESSTWETDGTDLNTYYFKTAVDGSSHKVGEAATSSVAGALGTDKIGLTLKHGADNSYQGATITFTVSVEVAQLEYWGGDNAGTGSATAGTAAVAGQTAVSAATAKDLAWPA